MNIHRLRLLAFLAILGVAGPTRAQESDLYSRPRQAEPSRDYDALHYRIQLRFDQEKRTFSGRTTVTVTPFADGFGRCVLDAATFKVSSVVDAQSKRLEFEQTKDKLIVHLGRQYDFGEKVTFTVAYDTAGSERPSEGRATVIDAGMRFNSKTANNPAVISALSFPRGARHWFPCFDHPSDKATTEILATVPQDYSALSNGRLVGVTEHPGDKTRTFHWSQEKPHSTYLTVLVAGPYTIIRDKLGSLPINYWVYEKDAANALRSFRKTPAVIQFFSETYGVKYPWAKYDQITIPDFGGGAECTSATILTHGTIHDARADQDYSSTWLVAHEAAHQWWGDLVTLRDWGHTWINEGMATYGEYLHTRHDLGDDEGAVNLLRKKNRYLSAARRGRLRPIVHDRWLQPNDNFDVNTYQRAAAVIHMMRFVLGDEPFFRALRHFLTEHAFQPVDTHDFLIAIKNATGQNLEWFFDQWLYSPGHPIFDVGYDWNEGAKKLRLRIAQMQDTSGRTPVFKTPVVIRVVTAAGDFSQKVWIEGKLEQFEFDCPQAPLMVRFDEGNHLLKQWTFSKSIEELLYQMKHDDVIGRAWAATSLNSQLSDDSVVRALLRVARADPFWFVRRAALQSVTSAGNGTHLDFLKQLCADADSKVRTAALSALGDLKKPELVAFLADQFKRDDSYLAQAAAIRAIGRCGTRAALETLDRASRMSSPRNVIRNAATQAKRQIEQRDKPG